MKQLFFLSIGALSLILFLVRYRPGFVDRNNEKPEEDVPVIMPDITWYVDRHGKTHAR